MQIIVSNIPIDTTLKELLKFASSWGLIPFKRSTSIRSCELIDLVNQENRCCETHGLVSYSSIELGQKAIKRLDGKKFRGEPVIVRPYEHRSPGDKRIQRDTQGLNRPPCRRRKELKIVRRNA